MNLNIREIDKKSESELHTVTKRCMDTVLETIPEFEGSEEIALKSLKNFTFDKMSQMIKNDFDDPSKRIIVAEIDREIVGQALYSIKTDKEDNLFGFLFSCYVDPNFRRKGITTKLMDDAFKWFSEQGAQYIFAQTHVTNLKLQELFKKLGFDISGPFDGNWESYQLKKDL